MKITAIIQARMGSTRLPGKVLTDLAGKPMLQRVVERVSKAEELDQVVVATTVSPDDDRLETFCREHGINVFRGSHDDVLDRYYQAAKKFGADVVVRITADCPLADCAVIDRVVSAYKNGDFDYCSNINPPTYPDGLDTEVFPFAALELMHREAILKSEREHVTLFLRNRPERFRIGNVVNETDYSAMRWTVDEPRDLVFVRTVYAALGDRDFGMVEVVSMIRENPSITKANEGIIRDEGLLKSLKEDGVFMGNTGDGGNKAEQSGPELYRRAKELIPGGTQLLSKRPEMFLPDHWPSYYSRAKGAEVWDLQGRKFIDMSYSALGACILGYADDDVDRRVAQAIANGSATTLNCPEEVELAELLVEMHPWAGKIRYARSGGEAMSIAVRIARAATGRDKVAFCGYHGWSDWYLAANLGETDALNGHLLPGLDPSGVPRGLRGTALPFRYNELADLEMIVAEHGDSLAAVVMEPQRNFEPAPGFLEGVRKIASERGLVLVFDEITSGWRKNDGGVHLSFGINPDICVFAKGMSNGYPMAAILGIPSVMEAAQKSFISSTNWTERIGPVAALATIRKCREHNVSSALVRTGNRVQQIWKDAAADNGIEISIGGIPALGHFAFQGEQGQKLKTLFVQFMLDEGFLATNACYANFSHSDEHLAKYAASVSRVFGKLAAIIADRSIDSSLIGPVAHTGFRRLT